jgi:hypothetical protein
MKRNLTDGNVRIQGSADAWQHNTFEERGTGRDKKSHDEQHQQRQKNPQDNPQTAPPFLGRRNFFCISHK